MAGWNFASIFGVVAQEIPDAVALVQGPRQVTWKALDARATALASFLVEHGLQRQDKLAQYLYNTPEYLESVIACFKGAFVPLNTNFRYGPDELIYLWDNGDVAGVIFHGMYAPTIEKLLERTPRIKVWLWVDDGSGPCPVWATPYEEAATASSTPRRLVARSPNGGSWHSQRA